VRVGHQLRSLLQDEKIRARFEDIVSSRKEQDDFLVVVWSHDDEPKVKLVQEPELSPYLGDVLKGRSHAVTLALHGTLLGLRLDDLRRNAEEQLQSRHKRSQEGRIGRMTKRPKKQ
jgi:hypothetical protein